MPPVTVTGETRHVHTSVPSAARVAVAVAFVCLGAGDVCGRVGLVVSAIFLPLAFPLSLTDSSHAENTVVALGILITALFAIGRLRALLEADPSAGA